LSPNGKDSMTKARFTFLTVLVLVVFGSFFGVRPAAADSINYTVTSTYVPGTSNSAYSSQNTPFNFTFSEPTTLSSLATAVPVTFTLGSGACCTFSGLGEVTYYPASQLGLFDIATTVGGDTFTWEFFGPQIYSVSGGAYAPLLGTFQIDNSPLSSFSDSKGKYSGEFSGGTVVATDPVSTSEPSTLLMLACGLLALAPLFARRLRQAPVAR
jgi:hypothetical protein